jgi:hypothetical protein
MSTAAMRRAFDNGAAGKGKCAAVLMTGKSGGERGHVVTYMINGKGHVTVDLPKGANVIEESVKAGADWAAKQKE